MCGRINGSLRGSTEDHSEGNVYPNWVSCLCLFIEDLASNTIGAGASITQEIFACNTAKP